MILQSFTKILTIENNTIPMYQKIKEHILENIAQGEWKSNQKLPSENEISTALNISRMTVNRAFKELTEEGYLFREKGAGTFVATPIQLTPFFELFPISQELAIEGKPFSAEILKLQAFKNNNKILEIFPNQNEIALFYSEIIYFNDNTPIQYEKRYVSQSFAPNYLKEKFQIDCSTTYLQTLSPILSQKHSLEAVIPDDAIRQILEMKENESCFKITETLLIQSTIVSYAEQYYPASRYKFHSKI